MGFTVLIVEDDLDSRVALGLLLELDGFRVIAAPDAATAILLLDIHSPDLIITDICMPGMSGIEFTRHIRSIARFNNLPVIAVTAAAEHAHQLVLEAGASACFAKPINVERLQKVVRSQLSQPVASVINVA
jgi:CheY-like chemotaxis protein